MKSKVYSLNEHGGIRMQLALSCRAPVGAAPCADPAALRGCCGGAASAAPSRAPLFRELLRSFSVPHSALWSSMHCHFSFRGWGGELSCRKDRIGAPPPAGAAPLREPRAAAARPPSRGAALAARPAPISPQRYLKGLVDISRVGWAVWVGFPVLEVSCSRPSLVPPSRPGPALPAPEGPASSRLPPLGLDLHSDV